MSISYHRDVGFISPSAIVCVLLMTVWSCKPVETPRTEPTQGLSVLALVIDQETKAPLARTLASIRPAKEPFRVEMQFFPIDSAGLLKVGGLQQGQYAIHLKRIGYFQKDTILHASTSSRPAVVPMVRDHAILR
jgi:hypothetical protein